MDYKSLQLVAIKDIPKAESTPVDDLLALYKLGIYMEQICFDNNGIGLSAVQVGIPYDFFVVLNLRQNEYYLHCSYEGIGEKTSSIEGCLSIKDNHGNLVRYEVQRFKKIKVKGKKLIVSNDDPTLSIFEFEKEIDNLSSVVFQHEIDHQNGILISDIGKPIYLHGAV